MILRASSTSEAPAAVGRTPVWVRSNATTPNSRSKVVTCFTRAGVEMLSRSAAFEKLPSSAAATIASRRLSYISPPLSSVNQWFIPYQNIGNSQAAGAALAFDSHIGANRRDGNE